MKRSKKKKKRRICTVLFGLEMIGAQRRNESNNKKRSKKQSLYEGWLWTHLEFFVIAAENLCLNTPAGPRQHDWWPRCNRQKLFQKDSITVLVTLFKVFRDFSADKIWIFLYIHLVPKESKRSTMGRKSSQVLTNKETVRWCSCRRWTGRGTWQ